MAQSFEEFWNDVLDYCDEVNITPQYAKMSSSLMVNYTVYLFNLFTLPLEKYFEKTERQLTCWRVSSW